MLPADPSPRPMLLNPGPLARALDALRAEAPSTGAMWRLLTERYVVDLDALAALLPPDEPETVWLAARD